MKLNATVRGNGAPLLMVHGTISDGTFFTEAAEILSRKYKVICYDRRGYGDSPVPDDRDFSMAAQAEDAAEILRTYAGKPAWIVGSSGGGLVSIEMCLRHPELVRGMVLVEPALCFDEDSAGELAAWNEELNSFVEKKRIKKALVTFNRVIGATEKTGSMTLEDMKRVYGNLENFMYGELNEIQHYRPAAEDLKSISVPVRIGVTEKGAELLVGRCTTKGAAAIGWPVVTFPGYHNTINDNPAQCAEQIDLLLQEFERSEK